MLKKIVLLTFLCLPLGMMAQELKIAYVNSMEIFNAMPETSAAETTLANLKQEVRAELQRMESQYNSTVEEFKQLPDSLSPEVKINRMKELEGIRERMQTYYQQSEEAIAKKSNDLQAPIVQKIKNAIKTVGDEQGYTYMLEEGAFLYASPKAIDATSLVKAKLGLKK